jgi:hypothetical protein
MTNFKTLAAALTAGALIAKPALADPRSFIDKLPVCSQAHQTDPCIKHAATGAHFVHHLKAIRSTAALTTVRRWLTII